MLAGKEGGAQTSPDISPMDARGKRGNFAILYLTLSSGWGKGKGKVF